VLSKRLIERSQNKIIIDSNSVYHRDSVVCGILHEKLYVLVAALPFYPFDSTTLFYNQGQYPAKQAIEVLQAKHGEDWLDKYKPPTELRIDVMDELKPRNLEQLHTDIETLQRRIDARAFTGNWERDFARTRYNATCIEGDRTYFSSAATSALDEGRVQVSSTAKNLLSRDSDALLAFGICVSALTTLNPYRSGGRLSHSEAQESHLASSYT
jgi:hypothetical protein